MTQVSDAQIAAVARAAGFPEAQIATAVSVCLAESGGKDDATNHNHDGSTDYGLWQINSVHSSILAVGAWNVPLDNARMALSVWRDSGWHAWTTYNTGKYLLFESRGKIASGTRAQPPSNSGPNKPVVRTWITRKGQPWKSYLNKPIAAPPVPITYGKPTGPTTADTSGASVPNFPDSKDMAVFHWLTLYWDDGSFAKLYGGSFVENGKMTNAELHGHLYDVVAHQQQKRYGEVGGVADPGKAEAGIGPNPISDLLAALGKFIDFITNPHNWMRVAFFIAGLALALTGASSAFGIHNPVGSVIP